MDFSIRSIFTFSSLDFIFFSMKKQSGTLAPSYGFIGFVGFCISL